MVVLCRCMMVFLIFGICSPLQGGSGSEQGANQDRSRHLQIRRARVLRQSGDQRSQIRGRQPRHHLGQMGSGEPTLLLIHGNVGSSRWWEPVWEQLKASYTVVRVDLRGCGQSEQ